MMTSLSVWWLVSGLYRGLALAHIIMKPTQSVAGCPSKYSEIRRQVQVHFSSREQNKTTHHPSCPRLSLVTNKAVSEVNFIN